MRAIELERYQNIVLLTGAGVSVASGLRPYRGPGGLWESLDPQHADVSALQRDPHGLWKLFGPLRSQIAEATPNAAHEALAAWEQRAGSRRFVLATQNVDGLHQRAGSQQVVELHGDLAHTRCSDPQCDLPRFPDPETHLETLPLCPRCHAPLRPDIVLFGESLPVDAEWKVKKALRHCDLFIAIGTSGTVSPASSFVRGAQYAGARTVLVNLTPMEPPNPYFGEEILGAAEDILPQLLA